MACLCPALSHQAPTFPCSLHLCVKNPHTSSFLSRQEVLPRPPSTIRARSPDGGPRSQPPLALDWRGWERLRPWQGRITETSLLSLLRKWPIPREPLTGLVPHQFPRGEARLGEHLLPGPFPAHPDSSPLSYHHSVRVTDKETVACLKEPQGSGLCPDTPDWAGLLEVPRRP